MRGHGEGSLYKLRRPTAHDPERVVWVAEVSLSNGHRRRRMAPTFAEARKALAVLQRAATAGATESPSRLGPFLERWVTSDHDWAPATRRKHESIVRVHLVPALGDLRLSELSPRDVEAVLSRAGVGPRVAFHIRATLRRALEDARREGLVTINAAALARSRAVRVPERVVLDAAQARALIDSTRGTEWGPLWCVLVTTGLRISEALGLAWSDVDLATPAITVRHTLHRVDGEWQLRPPKTDKSRRTVALTRLAADALRQQRERQAAERGAVGLDGLVFTTSTGMPVHGTNLLPKLRDALAAAGLPKVSIHDLRHSAATMLYALGVPLPTIADLLGHSTVRVTADLYRHRVAELQRDAADRLQGALG